MASTPLLESHGRRKEEEERWWRRCLDLEEAKKQFYFAVPMILTNMSYYGITLVSVMFAGHLGQLELAGSTLGNSWSMVTGIALMTGLSGALETLCGQGFGAKMYKMLGIYLQTSIITSTFFCILVSIMWCFSETILLWLHQDPHVSKMAAVYLKYFIPGIFAYGYLQCALRFLQTQSVVIPLVICSVVPLVLHFGITYLSVYVLGFGFKAASLSASLSLWISFFMLACYIKFSDKFRHTWGGLSLESFHHVLPYMKLALPSALMVCLEYWAFEFLVLLAGLLPDSENSTSLLAMCVNTEALAFMVTYGFAAVASTHVSNELGAGNIEKAKNAVSVALKLAVVLAMTTVLVLLLGHDLWASFFSDSPVIIHKFAYMTPLLAFSMLFDTAQGVLSGVARGCGWQHLAAWTNLVTFYGIGAPLALLFGFKLGFQDKGLWIGLICGLACQASTLLVITLRTKWKKLDLPNNDETSHMIV
ncbi:multidrug resistance protein MATE family protein [Dioscorea alata]|uniref:Multidrug resistance protein MATE family protein n=1 Tax=Dioscorea alata TaxID=55571 RepID=A0ACB7UNJ9_DIOAL|nr:multidrug resistance protein MATE family protein [Dioscorea alata]